LKILRKGESMDLRIGDYIEGSEYYGSNVRRIKGWVRKIHRVAGKIVVTIQCDDGYNGRRANEVHEELGDIVIISREGVR